MNKKLLVFAIFVLMIVLSLATIIAVATKMRMREAYEFVRPW